MVAALKQPGMDDRRLKATINDNNVKERKSEDSVSNNIMNFFHILDVKDTFLQNDPAQCH